MMIEETISRARELTYWMEELKAYKDTGLLPKEIAALQASNEELKKEAIPLMQAKIEGRLVVLPCRPTDTVYILEDIAMGTKVIGKRVVSAQITSIAINGKTEKPVYNLLSETYEGHTVVEPGSFYLSLKAAEAALKAKEGKPWDSTS